MIYSSGIKRAASSNNSVNINLILLMNTLKLTINTEITICIDARLHGCKVEWVFILIYNHRSNYF